MAPPVYIWGLWPKEKVICKVALMLRMPRDPCDSIALLAPMAMACLFELSLLRVLAFLSLSTWFHTSS